MLYGRVKAGLWKHQNLRTQAKNAKEMISLRRYGWARVSCTVQIKKAGRVVLFEPDCTMVVTRPNAVWKGTLST